VAVEGKLLSKPASWFQGFLHHRVDQEKARQTCMTSVALSAMMCFAILICFGWGLSCHSHSMGMRSIGHACVLGGATMILFLALGVLCSRQYGSEKNPK